MSNKTIILAFAALACLAIAAFAAPANDGETNFLEKNAAFKIFTTNFKKPQSTDNV